MRLELFDYPLPPDRIAQEPVEPRDSSRLLVAPAAGSLSHHRFSDLPSLLQPGDLLVVNDTRVTPARLWGRKILPDGARGARVEVLLLRRLEPGRWMALVRPGRRVRAGAKISIQEGELEVEVGPATGDREREVRVSASSGDPEQRLRELGVMPLPPYITAPLADPHRYQTIYSDQEGSAAAPTAGLHFTEELIHRLGERGVGLAYVTLHIGLATFQPVTSPDIEDHVMHQEWYSVPPATLDAIRNCRGHVVAAGTTTARCLESAWASGEAEGTTTLFITPGFRWRVVDLLLTNFHMPRSSLLIMVSSFAGMAQVRDIYRTALQSGYRFLSFGDAMLLEREDVDSLADRQARGAPPEE